MVASAVHVVVWRVVIALRSVRLDLDDSLSDGGCQFSKVLKLSCCDSIVMNLLFHLVVVLIERKRCGRHGLFLSRISEVLQAYLYTVFIHGNSLFEDMESPWDDIQLRDNFLKSESEFFACACDIAVVLLLRTLCVWVLLASESHIVSCFNRRRVLLREWSGWSCLLRLHVGFSGWGLLSLGCLMLGIRSVNLYCSSFRRAWSLSCDRGSNWNCFSRCIWSFAAKIINHFGINLIQIWFPAHYNWISSRWSEEIPAWWEANCVCGAFMAIQAVQDVALSQIPDFDSWVSWRW